MRLAQYNLLDITFDAERSKIHIHEIYHRHTKFIITYVLTGHPGMYPKE